MFASCIRDRLGHIQTVLSGPLEDPRTLPFKGGISWWKLGFQWGEKGIHDSDKQGILTVPRGRWLCVSGSRTSCSFQEGLWVIGRALHPSMLMVTQGAVSIVPLGPLGEALRWVANISTQTADGAQISARNSVWVYLQHDALLYVGLNRAVDRTSEQPIKW